MTKTQYIKIDQYLVNNNIKHRYVGSLGMNFEGKFIINTRDVYFLEVLEFMQKNHIKFLKIERKAIGAISIYLSNPRKCCIKHMKELEKQRNSTVNFG